VQTKCKLNKVELFLNLFYIQSIETENKKYDEDARELENGKVRFRLNIYVKEEEED